MKKIVFCLVILVSIFVVSCSTPAEKSIKELESIVVEVENGSVDTENEFEEVLHSVELLHEKYKDLAFAVLCEFEYSDTVAEGDVIRYSYETAADVIKGGLITLYVSVGNERTTAIVPGVVGKSVADAAAEIEAAGLIVGEIKYIASAVRENRVITQSISEGSSVPGKITKVDIVVSGGLYHGLIPRG